MTYAYRARAVLAVSFISAFVFAAACPPAAQAATRPQYSRTYDYWRNSSEGSASQETIERATSRRGISSAAQKAIDALDDDPVKNLPIPVLLGVSLVDITPNFGDPRDGGARKHEGEDILAPKDDYIVSPTDAVVTSMGTGSSAGNYVYTANPGDETFAYMHLDKFAEGLKRGSVLKKGDLIGYVGDTGDAKGGVTHLHFEIRHGRTATDPFPRLAREFTLDERIDAVEDALKDADDEDEDEDAEMLVRNYRGTFLGALALGMNLPSAIDDALEAAGNTAVTTSTFYRDLIVGARGSDVTALQAFLIGKNSGPGARALAAAGATGYFGPVTQAALAEYQVANGIAPAAGYFGPLTRARVSQ
ncbi:MAG: peptidoglycan DD-metalloendopeptidase family protein [bacterium]